MKWTSSLSLVFTGESIREPVSSELNVRPTNYFATTSKTETDVQDVSVRVKTFMCLGTLDYEPDNSLEQPWILGCLDAF
jgi:hypothetical protein